MVVLIDSDAVGDIQRFVFRKYSRPGIPFFLGIIPIRLVSFKFKVKLSRLHLGFLQGEEVCIQFLENIGKSFAHAGPEAIYVPRYKLYSVHSVPSLVSLM